MSKRLSRAERADGAQTPGSAGWGFWLKWIGASTAGWTVAFLVAFMILITAAGVIFDDVDAGLGDGTWGFAVFITLLFGLGAAGSGFAEWLVLRRRIDHAGVWVLAKVLGCIVLALLFVLLENVVSEPVNEVLHNAAGGGVAGLIQVRILRRRFESVGWWVPLSAAAFVAAGLTSYLVTSIGGSDIIGGPLGFGVMAMMTGTGLVWRMRRPVLATPGVSSDAVVAAAP